jgi:hypothetical protein
MTNNNTDGRRRPRSLETKKNISERNKRAVRGVKLMKGTEVKKVSYDDIIPHLESGWIFKAQKVHMNKDGKSMCKLTASWRKWIDLGWEWGSLATHNLKTCIHCGVRDKAETFKTRQCTTGGKCE